MQCAYSVYVRMRRKIVKRQGLTKLIGYTSMFSRHFYKGKQLCNFEFSFMTKMELTLKGKNLLLWEQNLVRADFPWKTENGRVTPHERVSTLQEIINQTD